MTPAELLTYCMSKPGTWQDEPWEGDVVAKFVTIDNDGSGARIATDIAWRLRPVSPARITGTMLSTLD